MGFPYASGNHDLQSDKRKEGAYETSGEMNKKILLRVVSVFWSVRNELLARRDDTRSKLKIQGGRDFLDDFDLSVESFAYFLAEIVGTFVGITWGFISSVIAIINAVQEEE
ncbi:hypothetical protein PR048_022099 [Dryococelus australis]|uniref:Uncharacterized protein n=1 Tax=Dryococelus australis TaxID=614101 RepID=A0ABQ9H045_9NEOP|nr:hypothetical protein PR048_022099 [Dryococelus australis]